MVMSFSCSELFWAQKRVEQVADQEQDNEPAYPIFEGHGALLESVTKAHVDRQAKEASES